MTPSTHQAAVWRHARRACSALRSLHPGAAAWLTLALLIAGAGGAAAANGGNFILGKSNSETATATLSNSKGTPLKLTAPAGKAPLAVNRKTMVASLNAQYLSGFTAAQLKPTGGADIEGPGSDIFIDSNGEVVARTAGLAGGTYLVTATALLDVGGGDAHGLCYIAKESAPSVQLDVGGATQEGDIQAAETAAPSVSAGDALEEVCSTGGNNGSLAIDAGIIAIRILPNLSSRHHAAHVGTSAKTARGAGQANSGLAR